LPSEDRNVIDFNNLNAPDILLEVRSKVQESKEQCLEKQWKFTWNGEEIKLRDIAGKIVDWISKFVQIGDIVIQYDPVHSAIPWAGFRLLFQVNTLALFFYMGSLPYPDICTTGYHRRFGEHDIHACRFREMRKMH